ncbi:MAG: rod shape-determining protein RodA [Terriglobia bacterium]
MDWPRFLRRIDFGLLLVVAALLTYGMLMLYSADKASGGETAFFSRQIIGLGVGLVLLLAVSLINYNALGSYAVYIYFANIAVLVGVTVFGGAAHGAQRWLSILGFQFQPSEIAKVLLIVTLATFLASRKGNISRPRDLLFAFLHVGIPLIIIAKQPDLGTSLVLVAILMGMLLAGGTRLRYYLAIIMMGALVFTGLIKFQVLDDYQLQRLMVFFNPGKDPSGASYNLTQSKIAVGSGQLSGKGLFSGTQTNLEFIPNKESDFIFSVVGEQLGFVGGALLLAAYFLLIVRATVIAANSKNLEGSLIAIGILSMWLFQIFVNIGMTIGIMPITGIPLPFLSYGGSAMVTNLVASGLLLAIYRHRLY